jgi:hypothetical protein
MRLDKFLFCESARNEITGQLTLVGLFQTDLLRLQTPPGITVFQLPTLTCVAIFDHMVGIASMQIQCQVTLGSQIIQQSPPMSVTRPDRNDRFHTVTIAFSPFQGPSAGDYTFKLTMEAGGETTSFSRRLRIEIVPATSQTPTSQSRRPH